MILVYIGLLVGFGYITYRSPHKALGIFFACLPLYLVRLHIGPLPTTLLELLFAGYMIGWSLYLYHFDRSGLKQVGTILKASWTPPWATLLVFLGATIGLFVAVNPLKALGEWRAFFLEPIVFLLPMLYVFQEKKGRTAALIGLMVAGSAIALYAILQFFTGIGVPTAFNKPETGLRATAWFGYPNAVGLFLAPLIPLLYTLLAPQSWRRFLLWILLSALFIAGILAAKGSGPLLGAIGGVATILFLLKKFSRIPMVMAGILGIVIVFFVLPTTNSLRQELTLQNWSGFVRQNMWAETTELLRHHPIVGVGLASYSERVAPYHIHKAIEIFHLPHNLLLAMWVNTGILGVVGMVWIFIASTRITLFSWKNVPKEKRRELAGAFGGLISIGLMGLADTPYFKNDLVFLFWIPVVLVIMYSYGSDSSFKTPNRSR